MRVEKDPEKIPEDDIGGGELLVVKKLLSNVSTAVTVVNSLTKAEIDEGRGVVPLYVATGAIILLKFPDEETKYMMPEEFG